MKKILFLRRTLGRRIFYLEDRTVRKGTVNRQTRDLTVLDFGKNETRPLKNGVKSTPR